MRGVSIQGVSVSPNPVDAGKSFLISVKAESQANRFKFPLSIIKAIGLMFKPEYTEIEKVGTSLSGMNTYDEWLNPKIEGSVEQITTGNSPSPDYPSHILNSENFDAVSCGRNLLDIYSWINSGGVVPINNIITQTFASGALFLNDGKVMSKLRPNHPYNVAVNVIGSDAVAPANIVHVWGYDTRGVERHHGSLLATAGSVGVFQFTTPTEGNYAIALGGVRGTFMASLQIMVLDGDYTLSTLPPYQPYHATTASIINPLRSVGGVSDSIEVSRGKVEVVRRVVRFVNSSSARWSYSADYSKNGFNCWTLTVYPALKSDGDKPVLCSILKRVGGVWGKSTEGVTHQESPGNRNALLWVKLDATKFPDTASLLAKSFYIDYAPNLPPVRTNITTTPLGQALLSMQTYQGYTQVYTNATIPPTLRARMRERIV